MYSSTNIVVADKVISFTISFLARLMAKTSSEAADVLRFIFEEDDGVKLDGLFDDDDDDNEYNDDNSIDSTIGNIWNLG